MAIEMPPIPRKHYFSSRGAPWVVNERLSGLELILQALLHQCSPKDQLGNPRQINTTVRRCVLDFIQAKLFMKAAYKRTSVKGQMDALHMEEVVKEAQAQLDREEHFGMFIFIPHIYTSCAQILIFFSFCRDKLCK